MLDIDLFILLKYLFLPVFTTFIMNEADVPSKPYPRDIMNWSESDVFGPVFSEESPNGQLSKVCVHSFFCHFNRFCTTLQVDEFFMVMNKIANIWFNVVLFIVFFKGE